jgi:flagellar biosynthesis/type III secretory pathway chaperone
VSNTTIPNGLARALADEGDALDSLLKVVERERTALVAHDGSSLGLIAEEKKQSLINVADCARARQACLTEKGFSVGAGSVRAWLEARSLGNGHLATLWDRVRDSLLQIQIENETNAKLIATHLKYLQQRLSALSGTRQTSQLYGADGVAQQGLAVREFCHAAV